jgi:hypothetical protein
MTTSNETVTITGPIGSTTTTTSSSSSYTQTSYECPEISASGALSAVLVLSITLAILIGRSKRI